MLIAIFFTIFPTLIFYPFFTRLIKSKFLKISFSWFCGQFITSILIFIVAILLSFFTTGVLQKSEIIIFIIICITLLASKNHILVINKEIIISRSSIIKSLILIVIYLFSFFFYFSQLNMFNGKIYTGQAYWDFQWHAPLIQNFAYGENFPPQNESFSGIPQTYHFFWGFLVSIYDSAGLDLVLAINYISMLCLFFLLMAVIGFSEEIFGTFSAGILSVLFIVTSSSLRFIYDFYFISHGNSLKTIYKIITNSGHPYFFSYIPGNPYGYNGNMFNMFYFLAERQIVIGIIILLFSIWIIYKRNKIHNLLLLLIGGLMGMFFLWHIYITIMVFSMIILIFIFDKDRKKTLILLSTFSLVFIIHVLFFKYLTNSGWFYPMIKEFPKLNFNFPTMGKEYPLSLVNAINYYTFAYGFKIIFLPLGLIYLFKTNKKLLLTLLAVIIPSFILINTVQLSPLSIWDNHKWLKPMNVIIDLITGFALYHFFFRKKKIIYSMIGIFSLILLTIGGFTELIPYLNSKPTVLYADYRSPLIRIIRQKTDPEAVFLTKSYTEVQLAGRKVFLGYYSGQDLGLRSDYKIQIINKIYNTAEITQFCKLTREYKIDYVEDYFSSINNTKLVKLETIDGKKNNIAFIDINATCGMLK